MGRSHSHFYIRMTKDALQNQYITTIHHKVAGEGVA